MSWAEKSMHTHEDGSQTAVIRVTARRIGLDTRPSEVKAAILDAIPKDAKAVVLDLEPLRYSGTEFFAVLLSIQKRCTEHKRHLRICNLAPIVEESLRLCKLHKILRLYPNLKAALA